MFVCVCEAVTEKDIHQQVAEGFDTVREISKNTCAGTNCGKCVGKIRQSINRSPVMHIAEPMVVNG